MSRQILSIHMNVSSGGFAPMGGKDYVQSNLGYEVVFGEETNIGIYVLVSSRLKGDMKEFLIPWSAITHVEYKHEIHHKEIPPPKRQGDPAKTAHV